MAEKPRILLVDDEPSIVKMVGKRLEVEGFEVLVAMDGQEGLTKAQTDQPDLIILDLMLPKLNGYEICTMLKQDTRYQNIPIMMFTAKAQDKDEKLGMECGANAYIRKPFRAQELLEKIRGLLAAASPPSPPASQPGPVRP
ncbi:MAG: response regulator [Candidatus Omnitrophica bacterium]|nr:response regulator [Candidatus Omnitrophota bacterium]